MSKLKIKHYKNQLSSYEYWLSELIDVNDELKAIKRIIEEPKVTQYGDKDAIEHSEDQVFKYHGILDKEQKLIKKRNEIEYNLSRCIAVLKSCDKEVASMLYGMYVKGVHSEDVAQANNYSRRQMFYLIDKEIMKL